MNGEPAVASPRWTAVLDEVRLADGTVTGVRVEAWPVVLVRLDGVLHALGGVCPHDLASLADARVEGDELVCSRHGARFRLCDGACGAGFVLDPLPCYPVRVREGRVEIDAAAVVRDPPHPRPTRRWDLTR